MFLLFQQRSPGKVLFDLVCAHLNLTEGDYFGLEYQDQRKMTVRHTLSHTHTLTVYTQSVISITTDFLKYYHCVFLCIENSRNK